MKAKITITLLIFGFGIIACNSENRPQTQESQISQNTESKADTTREPELQTFNATGTVISVPPSKRNFIVNHGDIPGFMNAMTMAFPVKDSTLLQGVSAQDSIKFVIEQKGRDTFVTEIEKIVDETEDN